MKLVPLGDKVVIKQLEAEEKTKGGIILTFTVSRKATRSSCSSCWTWRRGKRNRCKNSS